MDDFSLTREDAYLFSFCPKIKAWVQGDEFRIAEIESALTIVADYSFNYFSLIFVFSCQCYFVIFSLKISLFMCFLQRKFAKSRRNSKPSSKLFTRKNKRIRWNVSKDTVVIWLKTNNEFKKKYEHVLPSSGLQDGGKHHSRNALRTTVSVNNHFHPPTPPWWQYKMDLNTRIRSRNSFQAFSSILFKLCVPQDALRLLNGSTDTAVQDENEKRARYCQTSDLSFSINNDRVRLYLPILVPRWWFLWVYAITDLYKETPLFLISPVAHSGTNWYTGIYLLLHF